MEVERNMEQRTNSCVRRAVELLAIDSPSGYTRQAAEHVMGAYEAMGLRPEMTRKGGVMVCLNPEAPAEDGLQMEDVAKITDIVLSETSYAADQIKIMEAE